MVKNKQLKSKLIGIVLAAGTSTRMGCTKQLLSCGKQVLIERVVHAAEGSELYQVIVVLGYKSNEILKQTKFNRSNIVSNPNFIHGQSSSLIVGLTEACNKGCNAAMFILGDQPLITSRIINKLISFYSEGKKEIIVPTYEGHRGNPVIFSHHFFPELKLLTGDVGGKNIIKHYNDCVIEVSYNIDAILYDLDTIKDYKCFNRKISIS